MNLSVRHFVLGLALCSPLLVQAQVPVQPNSNHEQLLASADARVAANKRLVYDFWREVFEAGHMELAEKYMAQSYIQHNPNVATGRAAFVEFFSRIAKPKPIEPRVKAPLVAMVAEGDLVILSFVREGTDPKDASKHHPRPKEPETQRPQLAYSDALTMTALHARQFDWLLEVAREREDHLAGETPEHVAMHWARQQGVTLLEAYPIDKPGRSQDEFIWHGAKSMFDAAGFAEVARRKPQRPVVRLRPA